MIEIILLVFLTKKIGKIAEEKGRRPGRFKTLLVALWFAGEILGFIIVILLSGTTFTAYLFALICAAVGAVLSFEIAKSPDTKALLKSYIGFILSWFLPGLGHLLAKSYWKAVTFFLCISLMAALGLYIGGRIYPLQAENPLTILAFFSDLGYGALYFSSRIFSFGAGVLKNITFEFGTTYIAGAGLLNYLVALDAFDILYGKKK